MISVFGDAGDRSRNLELERFSYRASSEVNLNICCIKVS